MRRFRYLRDGLFLSGCLLYGLNRWIVKPSVSPGFLHSHFNDLLLVPCALPVMLFLHRKLALRDHDAPPKAGEIALHLAIWCVLFEIVGPRWMMHATGDPFDIVAYATGAVFAALWWNRA